VCEHLGIIAMFAKWSLTRYKKISVHKLMDCVSQMKIVIALSSHSLDARIKHFFFHGGSAANDAN
jgi:hypothetical protein